MWYLDCFCQDKCIVLSQSICLDSVRSSIASLSSCLAELFLCAQLKGDGLEPLRGSDRHTAARRTWQLEMEMVGQWKDAIVIMKPPMKGMNCNKQDISKAVESYLDLFQSFALRRPTMNDPDYWLCALYRCLPCQPTYFFSVFHAWDLLCWLLLHWTWGPR